MEFYYIFRRFYRYSDPCYYYESIVVYNKEEEAIEFVKNDTDKSENKWYHLDTFVVKGVLTRIYENGLQHEKKLQEKIFHEYK